MLDKICGMLDECGANAEIARERARSRFHEYRVYPDSINYSDGSFYFLARPDGGPKKLVIYGNGKAYGRFSGKEFGGEKNVKICDLSNENNMLLREIFPFARPTSHKGKSATIGLGDRLGIASPGHLRALGGKSVFPVLAQQSMRELTLTGRSFEDVMAAASWAVFQEGWTAGFGADGDHLKTAGEIKAAINCGFTMITLDCSEHIDNSVPRLGPEEIEAAYSRIPAEERLKLEEKYAGRSFDAGDGISVKYEEEEFKKIVLIYLKAIHHAVDVYHNVVKTCGRAIDFEISIDETLTPTSPESHYFVASELLAAGVDITSLAPRFCGEFQKGIDYIGDAGKFASEFEMHAGIARKFGYKISVHSGSDKFGIFKIVGEKTRGRFHLKTAGTNWLEAVRVIAETDPSLFREICNYAVDNFETAKKYYHVSADPSRIPRANMLEDCELPGLLEKTDARQVLHIAYGLVLASKKEDGSFLFKDRIYSLLDRYEERYYNALGTHIGRHLEALGI